MCSFVILQIINKLGDSAFLIGAIILYLTSIYFFVNNRVKAALALMIIATLAVRVYMSSLFPYLNEWDERYHALVGKNMALHPFFPKLYSQPLLAFDYKKWDHNSIWLHKEPLFLWFIGLSVKLFGVSEWTVRLPSAIASCILVLVIYRMGKILRNERVGYIAALLFSTNYFIWQLCCGSMGMDHNDIHFLLFISLSVWSWLEWKQSHHWHWLIAIGFFSGAAILTKWLVGLFVYLLWGIHSLLFERSFFSAKNARQITLSLLICLVVVLPWHIWIFSMFPKEAYHEISTYSNNLHKVYDPSHAGTSRFYLDYLPYHYSFLHYFIFLGVLISFSYKRSSYLLSYFLAAIAVYGFFSIAVHKSPNYVVILFPIGFLLIALFFDYVYESLQRKSAVASKLLLTLLCALLMGFSMRPKELYLIQHPDESCWWRGMRARKIHNTKIFKELSQQLNPTKDVIIYCMNREETELMFYSGCVAYGPVDSLEIAHLQKLQKNIYAFDTKDLPSYVLQNRAIKILNFDYKTNEW